MNENEHETMKRNLIQRRRNTGFTQSLLWIVLALCLTIGLFSACNKNDPPLVLYKVTCNMPDVPVRVYGLPEGNPLIVKGNYEKAVLKDTDIVGLEARCDNPEALITLEVFVNGKSRKKVSGNRWLTTGDIPLK